MSSRISLRLAIVTLSAASVFPLTVLGQSQDQTVPSVADAARNAREQKKAAAAKQPVPVITDDTLKPSSGAASAAQSSADSGNTPNASATPAPAEQAAPGTPASNAEQKDSAELAALKQQVAEAQKGLDLLQRDLALQQDTYFSNPDRARDTAGKAKLDTMQQQIADKQKEVDALKSRLAALQPASGSTPPAPPAAPPQF